MVRPDCRMCGAERPNLDSLGYCELCTGKLSSCRVCGRRIRHVSIKASLLPPMTTCNHTVDEAVRGNVR